VQSEATVPFAGLHQLLRPVLTDVDGLPEVHRAALAATFGWSPRSTTATPSGGESPVEGDAIWINAQQGAGLARAAAAAENAHHETREPR
jgi:hypothetical protein